MLVRGGLICQGWGWASARSPMARSRRCEGRRARVLAFDSRGSYEGPRLCSGAARSRSGTNTRDGLLRGLKITSCRTKLSYCLARRFRLPEPLPVGRHGRVGRRSLAPESDDLGTILRGRPLPADDQPGKWLTAFPASQLPGVKQDPNGSITNLARGNGSQVWSCAFPTGIALRADLPASTDTISKRDGRSVGHLNVPHLFTTMPPKSQRARSSGANELLIAHRCETPETAMVSDTSRMSLTDSSGCPDGPVL
jgi:hypothetical protein